MQTADPLVFLAVTIDGEPIEIRSSGDALHIDILGPQQSISVRVRPQ